MVDAMRFTLEPFNHAVVPQAKELYIFVYQSFIGTSLLKQ